MTVNALAVAKISPPLLFGNLDGHIKTIATKSRRYSELDRNFISKETGRLLEEGIIEFSRSPWRAQV